MFIAIAIILALLWVFGFVVFHVTSAVIHLAIILAVVAVIAHFVTGARRGVGRPI